MHLLHGEERFLVDQELKKIVGDMSALRFDMKQHNISEVLEEANSFGFFEDSKMIVLDNCYFLESEKALSDNDMKLIEKYLASPNDATTLVFMANKIDKRKKLSKRLLKEATVFEGKVNVRPQNWLKKQAKLYGFSLDEAGADYMTAHLGNSLYLLDSELQKLSLAYPENKSISVSLMDSVLSRTLESDIFKLMNAIVEKDEQSLHILNDLLLNGNDAIAVTLVLSSKIRTIHQILLSENLGVSLNGSIHPYALQIATKQATRYPLEEIEEKLSEISNLELAMKRGEADKNLAIEMLVLKWLD